YSLGVFRVTPNKLVCKKCNSQFSKTSSVTTLRRHLKQIHSVVAPKIQRTLHQYCNDPHNSIDQRKRDDAVTNWIICDLQSINVVEKEEWHTMISAFDPRYRFHGRTTIHDHIISLMSHLRSSTPANNSLKNLCTIKEIRYLSPEID
ncbi:4289_t:CDS:2, partial [Entrophospora sp. SA101]